MVSNKAGVPDLICCLDGKMIAIEVKKKDGVVSPLQQHNLKKIEASGGIAFVARSMKFILKTFETKGNDLDALRLHSITLTSLFFAMNWMLKGPVMFRDFAICLVIFLILLVVSRYSL